MQLPASRGSADSTAATTKFAKSMLVMKRPRFSTCSTGFLALVPSRHRHLAGENTGIDADVGAKAR